MKILQELVQSQYTRNLKNLKTNKLGRNYIYYEHIDSTQKEIWRRINKKEIIDGLLIRAEKQTSGIGTHGKTWYTNEKNIAFSLYMDLNCDVNKMDGLTQELAEIIVDIINEMYNIKLEIKLPNDIYVKGKKLGGILTETKIRGNMLKFLVIGIGMNNSQMIFNEEIRNIATSFRKEFGIEIDIEKFIANFCNVLENRIIKRMEV